MTARIIAVVNQKGGVGKTTLAMELAAVLARIGNRVLVVDGDAQGTATRWASQAPDDAPFPAAVVNLAPAGRQLHREVRRFIDDFDYVCIDCPPAVDSPIPQSALLIADLALIPVIPSPLDLWAAVGIKTLVENAQAVNDSLTARLILNMLRRNTVMGREVATILAHFGIPLAQATLGLRVAYRHSASYGTTVAQLGADARSAAEEVTALATELLATLESRNVEEASTY